MLSADPSTPAARRYVFLFDGWQVWDGDYGVVRVGERLDASIEVVERSTALSLTDGAALNLSQLRDHHYLVTAQVLQVEHALVLDLGPFRALRRIHQGSPGVPYAPGTLIRLEVSLNLNGWPEAPWTADAARSHGTNHSWKVERITRRSAVADGEVDLAEASIDTVESAHQYCLLECSLIE